MRQYDTPTLRVTMRWPDRGVHVYLTPDGERARVQTLALRSRERM